MKLDSLPDLLTGWPDEFQVFLDYTCALHFKDKPDYVYMCKLFHDLCIHEGFQYDGIFDWCLPKVSSEDLITRTTMRMSSKKNVRAPSRRMREFIKFPSYTTIIYPSNCDLNKLHSHTHQQNLLGVPVLWCPMVVPACSNLSLMWPLPIPTILRTFWDRKSVV